MSRKYVIAYAAWCTSVLAMAAIALAFYRHVEGIGLRELADRLRATEDTEDTEPAHG